MKIIFWIALLFSLGGVGYYLINDTDQFPILSNETAFDDFLGVNTIRENKINVIKDQYQVAKFHRIFAIDSYLFTGTEFVVKRPGKMRKVDLSIPHDEYPNDKMGFNPSKAIDFNFDRFLTAMKENGLKSIPVLARNLLYNNVPDNNLINIWQIPWDDGGDPENPLDYKAYASFLYQFTARYGRNKLIADGGTIDPELLKLTADNQAKAGLDLIFAIEPGNEMDKDWFTERERASPAEMAAFLSAALDGHMGLMGEGHGILTADSSMKVLFPSPTNIKADYVLEVLTIMKKLRNDAKKYGHEIIPEGNLILTAHFYPFKHSILPGSSTSDIVENTDLVEKSLDFLKRIRAEYACPVYMTETGYDKVVKGTSDIGTPTTSTDIMDTPIISTYAQAKHIARLLLTMYGVGYDKAFIFTLRDPFDIGAQGFTIKYGTSGLARKNGDKDASWYVVDQMRKKLTGFHLEKADFNGSVKLMKLNKGDSLAYVYWSGTNDNRTATTTVQINDAFERGYIIRLADFASGFSPKEITVTDSVELEVTEFPALLFLE